MDLVALLPLDFVMLCIAGRAEGSSLSPTALGYFQLFRMLRLVRNRLHPSSSRLNLQACQHFWFASSTS